MGNPSTDSHPPENVNLPNDDDDDGYDDANDANDDHHTLFTQAYEVINQSGRGNVYINAAESSFWKTKPKLESYTWFKHIFI
jgi:hypothetical protein